MTIKTLPIAFALLLTGCGAFQAHINETDNEWENESPSLKGMQISKFLECAGMPYKVEDNNESAVLSYGAYIKYSHASEYCNLHITTDKNTITDFSIEAGNPGGFTGGVRTCLYIVEKCISNRAWTNEAKMFNVNVQRVRSNAEIKNAQNYGGQVLNKTADDLAILLSNINSSNKQNIYNQLSRSNNHQEGNTLESNKVHHIFSYGPPSETNSIGNHVKWDWNRALHPNKKYTSAKYDIYVRNAKITDRIIEFEWKLNITNEGQKCFKSGPPGIYVPGGQLLDSTTSVLGGDKIVLDSFETYSTGWRKVYNNLIHDTPPTGKWTLRIMHARNLDEISCNT